MIVISQQRLKELLFNAGIDPVDAPGSSYALADVDWIVGEFARALREEQADHSEYRLGSNDCVRFSRRAANLANEMFIDFEDLPEGASFAAGVFAYLLLDGNDHMVVIFVCPGETNDTPQIVYFDAQTCQITTPIRKDSVCCAEF